MGLKRSIPFAVRRWLTLKAVLTESSAPYRATDGKRFWDFDAGTGIMAPPVTYLQDVVQYITLMVGWGGAAALANIPGGGPIKRGYGNVLTFSVGANTKLEVPPFGQTGKPTVAVHMKASPTAIHKGNNGTATALG